MKPKSQVLKRLDTLEDVIKGTSGASLLTAVGQGESETVNADNSAEQTEERNEA